MAFALIAIPCLLVISGLVSVWLAPGNWRAAWASVSLISLYLALALILPFAVPTIIRNAREDVLRAWAKFRRAEVPQINTQPDITVEFGVITALTCFVFTIMGLLLIMLFTIGIAVNVDIEDKNIQNNFDSIRVLIMSMTVFFGFGLSGLATSYAAELKKSGQANGDCC